MRQQLSLEHRTPFLHAGLFIGGGSQFMQTFMVELNATTAAAAWAARIFARASCFLVHFYFVTARIESEIC